MCMGVVKFNLRFIYVLKTCIRLVKDMRLFKPCLGRPIDIRPKKTVYDL